MKDHLGVGRGPEKMTSPDQILAQLDIVEDFAVEADPNGAVGTRHGLCPTGEIDNAEPRMSKTRKCVFKYAVPIGPTMRDCADHALQQAACGHARFWPAEIARYAAHACP